MNIIIMDQIFGIKWRCAVDAVVDRLCLRGQRHGVGRGKLLASSLCLLVLGAGAHSQVLLLDEDFSRSAKGTYLEHSSESKWLAEEGRLIIGNGRLLNGQALGYAPNRTWANQIYSRAINATLAPDEAVELSFSAAVKTDASPEFYIYAMRLYDGDDYVQIQVKGGEDRPAVVLESFVGGRKVQSEGLSASYYEESEGAGLVAVAMLISDGSAQAYYDQSGTGNWLPIGDPIGCRLSTLDRLQLRYYAMGFWSAMDDLKVAIGKPAK
ncbi:hypothetical protein QEH52_12465 [Coraliomargarita sp. SDUM461003]|uniref:Uncharacterized protein n=1 Tax=Thalassobacterium maritimum TaxID=3041265 RepID=A0ABU1AYJ7_9BACT|nr:hypothetical protein [Coraliomargarita sp. SDUM461003]MDQ8208329.1 hypothetical protein [Coraliomargarita sp. SDUM461003]